MPIKPGDVVQIDPAHDARFGGCFMVVTEVREWGLIGYFSVPGEKGLAYYRVPNWKFKRVGQAEWIADSELAETLEKAEPGRS